MNCKEIKSLMSEFLDGELDVVAASEVRSHVEGCVECRRELRELEMTITLLHNVRVMEPPAGLEGSIRTRLAAVSEPSQTGRLWHFLSSTQLRVAAAACLVLGICTYGLLHGPGPSPEGVHVPASVRPSAKLQAGSPAQSGKFKEVSVKDIQVPPAVMPVEEVAVEKLEKSLSRDRAAASRNQNATLETEQSPAPSAVVRNMTPVASRESSRNHGGAAVADRSVGKLSDNQPCDDLVQTDKKKDYAEMAYAAKPSSLMQKAAGAAAMPAAVSSDGRMRHAEELPVELAESGPRIGLYEGDAYRELEKKGNECQSKAGDVSSALVSRKALSTSREGWPRRQITLVATNNAVNVKAELVRVAGRHSVSGRESRAGKQSLSAVNSKTPYIQIRKADYPALIEDLRRIGVVTDLPMEQVAEADSGKALLDPERSDGSLRTQVEVEIVP
ncbi:MAG: anti-sigma factor [bacterium]